MGFQFVTLLRLLKIPSLAPPQGHSREFEEAKKKENRKKNKNKTFILIGSEVQICKTSVGLAWEFFFCSYNNNSNDILILILKMVRVTVR